MNKNDFYAYVSKGELKKVADTYDTPGYVYFKKILHNQISRLKEATHGKFDIHYALKANPNLDVLSELASNGIGADVASEGELNLALKAGFSPSKIEFSGPGKRVEELTLAIDNNIASINIENIDEVHKIIEICKAAKTSANVGVRLNPTLEDERSGMRMAGDTPFGLKIDDAVIALKIIEENPQVLNFTGFHAHLASQELDANKLVSKYAVIIRNVIALTKNTSLKVKKINFGGGLGIKYFSNQSDLDLTLLSSNLQALLASDDAKQLPENVHFVIEPGRFLVGESGVFITKVLYRKKAYTKEFLITDGGLNANYVLAGGMGQVIRRNFELDVLTESDDKAEASFKFDVAGPLCTPQDIIANNVESDVEVNEGDYIVFFNCGAYGPSASPINFLSQKVPIEIII
ncbi:MAG: hypothetical protein ACKE5Q_04160 [Methylophilaceae bacterium]